MLQPEERVCSAPAGEGGKGRQESTEGHTVEAMSKEGVALLAKTQR